MSTGPKKLIIGNTLRRWELDMTKYVINTVEVVKRVYVADAYTEEEALKKQKNQAPEKVEIVGELTYSIEAINSYEYQKDWVEKASGRSEFQDGEEEPLKISEGLGTLIDPDLGPDQLKDYYDQ